MTIILINVVILLVASFFFGTWIRKLHWILYGISLGIGVYSFTQEITIINMGYVGLSFFLVVMFMSGLNPGKLRKRLMGNRAEYAIIGGIFVLVHGLKYMIYALDFSFFWVAPIYFYIGIFSVIVMIPLWMTSFMLIRKKMKGKSWKKLHKLAYVFYIMVFIHLIWINNQRIWFYVSLALLYIFVKYWDYLVTIKHIDTRKMT